MYKYAQWLFSFNIILDCTDFPLPTYVRACLCLQCGANFQIVKSTGLCFCVLVVQYSIKSHKKSLCFGKRKLVAMSVKYIYWSLSIQQHNIYFSKRQFLNQCYIPDWHICKSKLSIIRTKSKTHCTGPFTAVHYNVLSF